MASAGSKKARKATRGGVIAVLDVGTSKICCFIARQHDDGALKVVGVGHQISQGVRAGTIVDMEAAEVAIGAAVHTAEQMAGETIREVTVALTGGQPISQTVAVEVGILDHEVGDNDLRRALAQTRGLFRAGEVELLHAIPVGYNLDGNRSIKDPRGMFGERLGVHMHLLATGAGPVRNLASCIARCHLDIVSLVSSPYAAGLACLVPDELELGVTLIDLGGGTTSIAVFSEGNLVYGDCVPVGGIHVTNDIARGLTTPLVHAERMKILHGNALATPADEREIIDVPQVGEEDRTQTTHVPKSLLISIIQPRLEEIFELVRARLDHSGVARIAGRRVVLTGGASQLAGTRELAQVVLDKQVRLGKPHRINGLTEANGGPAFTTAAGLLQHTVNPPLEIPTSGRGAGSGGLWGRLTGWLRENL